MAEQKGKKRGRRAYLNDFQQTAGGDYVYTGQMVQWPQAGGWSRREALVRLWLCMLPGLAAALVGGCLSGTGMDGRAFVLLPYMVGLVLAACTAWPVLRLTTAGEALLRAYVFHETVERLPGLSLAWAICSGVTLGAELVNLAVPGFSGTWPMALLLAALEGISMLSALALRRTLRRTSGGKEGLCWKKRG